MHEDFFDKEAFFIALADRTRLRLLNLMRDDEICVCFFTEVLQELQPKISRHLAFLRNAGIIEARREGKWMHYKIIEPKNEFAAKILRDVLEWLENESEMKADRERLVNVCCAPTLPVQIQNAPRPPKISASINCC